LNCFGCRDISVPANVIAFPDFGETATIEGFSLSGIQSQREVVVSDRAIEVAKPQFDKATTIERIGVVRLEPQRFLAVRQRFSGLSRNRPPPASIVEGEGITRFEPNKFVRIGNSALIIPFFAISGRAAAERTRKVWVEANGFAIVGDGEVMVPAAGESPVVVRRGVVGIEADRLVVVLDRAVGIT
jgi:hypothetical protein